MSKYSKLKLHTFLILSYLLFNPFCKVNSQSFKEISKVTADPFLRKSKSFTGRGDNDQFGSSVAMDSNYAVVGAIEEDEDSTGAFVSNSGAIYIYKNNNGTWTELQRLVAPDRMSNDKFGATVSISGNFLIVGVSNNSYDTGNSNYMQKAGSAYIFKNISGRWAFYQKIVASDREGFDLFGSSVSISSDYIIVGAKDDDENGNGIDSLIYAGSAYIFKNINGVWTQVKKIVPTDREEYDHCGFSVSINDSFAFVGAFTEKHDTSGLNALANAGSVYIFRNFSGNWLQTQKVVASNRSANAYFGISMSLSGSYVAIGSIRASNAGSIYMFTYNGSRWIEQQRVTSTDIAVGDYFGYSVCLNDQYLMVGAYGEDQDTSGNNTISAAGSGYVFENISGIWTQTKKIIANDRKPSDNFGWSVAASGDYIFSCAKNNIYDTVGKNPITQAGAAYVFNFKSGRWAQIKKIITMDWQFNERLGCSVDIDSLYAIAGAKEEDDDINEKNALKDAGAAYIIKKSSSGKWLRHQKITPSVREEGDNFGHAVTISGDYLMVGTPMQDTDTSGNNILKDAGAVYVYKRNGNTWDMVQKITARDRGINDGFGYSLSMTNDLAIIGAYADADDTAGINPLPGSGSAYIFKLVGNKWIEIQKIKAYDKAMNDIFGISCDINDKYAVIGAWYSSFDTLGMNKRTGAGAAYVFKNKNGRYVHQQKLVAKDRQAGDYFGISVALSGNSENLIAGAYARDKDSGSYKNEGAAYIFSNKSGYWSQSNLLLPKDSTKSTLFGSAVAIGDNFAFVGSYYEKTDTNLNSGSVYQFEKNKNGTYFLSQNIMSSDKGENDLFGISLAYNKNNLAIGAVNEDEDSTGNNYVQNAGSVYFYSLDTCCKPVTDQSVVACDNYTSPSNTYNWNVSGTYYDTLLGFNGRDSILKVNLLIKKKTFHSIVNTTCNTFLSPSGKYNYTNSGIYYDTLVNKEGCDSILTLTLTINKTTSDSITLIACNDYRSPSTKYLWSVSGVYQDTIPNKSGCDSLLTINLTINKTTSDSITIIACNDYRSPSTKYLWSVSGVYQDTIINKSGCDSLLKIDLTINKTTYASTSVNACNNYLSPSKKYLWSTSGIYKDTLSGSKGCDSIITINLTVGNQTTASISENACGSYLSPSKKHLWTVSGPYMDTIVNNTGCDSIISINLTINQPKSSTQNISLCAGETIKVGPNVYDTDGNYKDTLVAKNGCDSVVITNLTVSSVIDVSTTLNNDTISANNTGAGYKWLDCNSGQIIPGENKQTYIAIKNGSYAVILTIGNCSDTSGCINITGLGITKANDIVLKIYPNPNNGQFRIELNRDSRVIITDIIGRELYNQNLHAGSADISVGNQPNGVYFISIICDDYKLTREIIINK